MTTIDKLKAARAALAAKVEAEDPRARLEELDRQIAAEEGAAAEAELAELRRRRMQAGDRLAQAAAAHAAALAVYNLPGNQVIIGMQESAIEARAQAAAAIERANILQALATSELVGLSAAVGAAEAQIKASKIAAQS